MTQIRITSTELGDSATAVPGSSVSVTSFDGGPGPAGPAGADGAPGAAGATGAAGPGVAVGGTSGQVLAKASSTDYDTHWVNQTGGTGGGAVASVNGQTGDVVLDASDVGALPIAVTGATIETADNPITGVGTIDVLTLSEQTAIFAVKRAGDAFPRMILSADPADTLGLVMGDGTIDPYNHGAALGSVVNADGVTLPNFDNSDGSYYGIATGTNVGGLTTYNIGADPNTRVAGNLGDICFRRDTPTVPGQRIYVCTSAGPKESAVWLAVDGQPLDSDLTAIAALATTTFGRALLTLADAAALRTAAGLGTAAVAASTDFDAAGAAAAAQAASQPLDSDLTAIAALTTTSYGRAFLALADAAAGRTALGLGTAATSATSAFDAAGAAAAAQAASQPLDSDLTSIAALTTTSYGRAFLALADAAAGRTALGLGTAATSASTDFQPVDSDLTAIAALTTTSFGRSFLALADAAAGRTLLGLGTLATQSGTFSGTSSGTNTGDQTITLTGDATGSGTGSFAVNVAKINGTALSGLATGLLKNTTTTGVPSIATAADIPNLAASQITSGVFAIARLATGTPDGTKFVRDDGTLATPAGGAGSAFYPGIYLAPTGASYETVERNRVGGTLALASGTLTLTAISLPAGFTVGHIAFMSGGSGAGTPTHWWFGLYDSSRVQLAVTADQTTTAWAGSTLKSLAVATVASGAASTFTTTYAGLHYVGIMMAATTAISPPAASGLSTSGPLSLAPLICGASDTAQTTPPAFAHTATTITQTTGHMWAYVGA